MIKKKDFKKEYSLSPYDANILVSEIETADFFEAVAKEEIQKLQLIGSQENFLLP